MKKSLSFPAGMAAFCLLGPEKKKGRGFDGSKPAAFSRNRKAAGSGDAAHGFWFLTSTYVTA
jgi:hypothetical protein